MKTTASKKSQKVILKNIAEKINKSLAIFNYSEEEETRYRAIIADDEIKVVPSERSNIFTGVAMGVLLETVNAYDKKYENLIWHVETKPVLKWDNNHEMYWVHAPQVIITFFND